MNEIDELIEEVKSTDDFHKANEARERYLARQQLELEQRKREKLSILWSQLGEVKSQCTRCGHTQSVKTIKSVKCFMCNSSYTVCPKEGKTNIVFCKDRSILFRIMELESGRRK